MSAADADPEPLLPGPVLPAPGEESFRGDTPEMPLSAQAVAIATGRTRARESRITAVRLMVCVLSSVRNHSSGYLAGSADVTRDGDGRYYALGKLRETARRTGNHRNDER